MHLSRVIPALAAAALSLGLLSACGDDSQTADTTPASLLTQDSFASTVADAMVESGSTHVTVTGTVSGQEVKAEGDQQIGATAADSRLSLQLEVLGIALDLRMIDQVVYANLGPLSQAKFVAIDLTDTSNPLVAQFADLAGGADVTQQLEEVKAAIDGLSKGGEPKSIDGVDAQPYIVTIDPSRLPQQPDGPAASEPVEITIFVGADDLPRRIVTDMGGQMITIDLTQWGEAADVSAPEADQISDQDLSDLFAGLSVPSGS